MNIKNQYVFYHPDLSPNPELEEKTLFQITRVLRLVPGNQIMLLDGKGKQGIYSILSISKNHIELELNEIKSFPPPRPLTLALGLLRKENTELVLQKAVELGASRIILFEGRNSVSRMKDREKKLDRWQKILVEAIEQSMGAYLPSLDFYPALQDIQWDEGAIFYGSPDSSKTWNNYPLPSAVTVIIGPEGGLSGDEIDFLNQAGAEPVLLSRNILRAETAAICALSQVNLLRL
jgi:16S rRNA (uracil1498-N3)-methyltransferase